MIVLLTSSTAAQDTKDQPEVKPILKIGAGSGLGDAALFLMVRTRPDLTEKEILGTLKRGLEKSGCQIDGDLLIRPIRPTLYEEFENLINQTTTADPPEADNLLVPRLIPAREVLWEFRLKQPAQLLRRLEVRYRIAGWKAYEPQDPRSDPQAPLTLTALGRYALRPEPNDEPLEYKVTISELEKKDSTSDPKEWPKTDRYFMIILRNFRGNRNLLFTTVQDGNQVPNPLTQVRLAPDLMFVFANLGINTPQAGAVLDGNDLVTQAPGLPGRKVRRVWMLFPLDEHDLQENRERYGKLDSDQLAREIRKNQHRVEDRVEVGPSSPPSWIELADLGNGEVFGRRIPLKDIKTLRDRYQQVYRLLVWEFDDGSTPPGAIAVKDANGQRVFFLDEAVGKWKSELDRFHERTPSK